MRQKTAKKEAWRPKCAAPRLVYNYTLFSDTFNIVYVRTTYDQIYSAKKENPHGGQVSGWTCRTCVQNFRIYLLTTLETRQEMYRPRVVPRPFLLLGLCLKAVSLLLPTGSSTRKVLSVHDEVTRGEFDGKKKKNGNK